MFETYNEKVEYCQSILDEILVRSRRRFNLYDLKISGQIISIARDEVEFDIYLGDQVQAMWLPIDYFKADDNYEDILCCLSFILFNFFEGVRRGIALSSKEVK